MDNQKTDWEAIDAVIDEALAAVQSPVDVELLQECRNRFRKRVPLFSRSYAAAAMALVLAASGGRRPARQGAPQKNREARDTRDTRETNKTKVSREKREMGDSADEQRQERAPLPRFTGEGVTMFLSAGRRQRLFPRLVIKMILGIPGVQPEMIGSIRIMDNYSFIILDPDHADLVINGLNGKMYKGRPLVANHAKRREDTEQADEGMAQESFDSADETEDIND